MFGIGLPEMLLIMALALIVIGPDKLPDLARSLAKGLMELKKTAEGLKTSFAEEGNPLDEIRPELEAAAKSLKDNLLDPPSQLLAHDSTRLGETDAAKIASEAYQELMKQTGETPAHSGNQSASESEEKTPDKVADKPENASSKTELGNTIL